MPEPITPDGVPARARDTQRLIHLAGAAPKHLERTLTSHSHPAASLQYAQGPLCDPPVIRSQRASTPLTRNRIASVAATTLGLSVLRDEPMKLHTLDCFILTVATACSVSEVIRRVRLERSAPLLDQSVIFKRMAWLRERGYLEFTYS